MSVDKITQSIIDPRATGDRTTTTAAPWPSSFEGVAFGVIDNSKPNFDRIADGLLEAVGQQFALSEIKRARKPAATGPADDAVYDLFANTVGIVMAGSGD